MGLFSFVKKIKIPKFITGIAVMAVGAGFSFVPVPGIQAVGAKIIYSGGAITIAGFSSKAVRFVKADKGKKWVAITEHEREALKKLRKDKEGGS